MTAPKVTPRKVAQPFETERSLLDDQPPKVVKSGDEDKPLVYRPGVLVRPLTDFYETIGSLVLLADPICGQAIISSASESAKALDELARVNPKVRKALIKLVSGGVAGKVLVAHLPIIMAVVAHHLPKVIPSLLSVMGQGQRANDGE